MDHQPSPPAAAELAGVRQFMHHTLELVADQVTAIDEGFVIRTPSFASVWACNHVRITEPVSFAEAVSLADRYLRDLPYRQIHVDHERTGWELEGAFRAEGWRVERDLLMVLRGGPDRDVDTGFVIEAGEDQMLELMGRWLREAPIAPTEEGYRQLYECTRRESRARGDRTFAVASADGELQAMTKLRSDGRTAQIEDVFTAPEARGRGYGRALVTHAVRCARAAEHDPIFIVADDNGWPKELYRKLGFSPAARSWAYHAAAVPA